MGWQRAAVRAQTPKGTRQGSVSGNPALQRLLRDERYAVVRGQGGKGKTALAAEFARWMVRSQQIRRAAFVSVEGFEKNITESVVDKLGHQLVKPGFSTQVDSFTTTTNSNKTRPSTPARVRISNVNVALDHE